MPMGGKRVKRHKEVKRGEAKSRKGNEIFLSADWKHLRNEEEAGVGRKMIDAGLRISDCSIL